MNNLTRFVCASPRLYGADAGVSCRIDNCGSTQYSLPLSPSLFLYATTPVLGLDILKILADQALEEGRIKTALNLYGDVIAMSPSTSRKLSPRRSSGPRSNNPSQKNHGPTTLGKPGTSQAAQSESSSAKAKAITTATTQETIGDALHGVGVALLAAGKFKEACRAWERCGIRVGGYIFCVRGSTRKGRSGAGYMRELMFLALLVDLYGSRWVNAGRSPQNFDRWHGLSAASG